MDPKPTRPLSAYNIFFHERRKVHQAKAIQETGATAPFGGLARTVAKEWKRTDKTSKAHYQYLAAKEKRQYALDLIAWTARQEEAYDEDTSAVVADGSEETKLSPSNESGKPPNLAGTSLTPTMRNNLRQSVEHEMPVPRIVSIDGMSSNAMQHVRKSFSTSVNSPFHTQEQLRAPFSFPSNHNAVRDDGVQWTAEHRCETDNTPMFPLPKWEWMTPISSCTCSRLSIKRERRLSTPAEIIY